MPLLPSAALAEKLSGHAQQSPSSLAPHTRPKAIPSRSFYQSHCVYLPAMVGWFFFSAVLSSYNKVVFGGNRWAFPCPLLLTSIHFLVQWIFSYAISSIFPITYGGPRIRAMTYKDFLIVSIPCGMVTSGDVGLSNLALVRISITFYTMIKSSTPIFVVLWAYFFGIERITIPLVLVVAIIATGECLTVMGEVNYDWTGTAMCLGASILSGARWTLVQLKLHQMDPPVKSAIAIMRILSPTMFLSMLLISCAIERPWIPLSHGYFETLGEGLSTLGLGLIGAIFAISMILCEFYLILHASAMVLMIGGVVKEMVTIFVGVEFFDDSLNRINLTGCAIVFMGVLLYKVYYHFQHQHDDDNKMEKHSRPTSPNGTRLFSNNQNILTKTTVDYTEVSRNELQDEEILEENPQEMEMSRMLVAQDSLHHEEEELRLRLSLTHA